MRHVRLLGLLLAAACASACKSGPRVTVCVLSAASDGLECSGPEGEAFFLPYASAEKYVCMSPADTKKLLKFCGGGQ